MRCVILQPSYIPWRGYFDQIRRADVFVFYDDVQYDKHGWRNRNRVKGPGGSQWLTIPVLNAGAVQQGLPINSVRLDPSTVWRRKHRSTLRQLYAKAPFVERYMPLIDEFYERDYEFLADLTIEQTIVIARQLGIEHTKFVRSSELSATGAKTDRLLQILKQVGATKYISGPSAKEYLDEPMLAEAGIELEYMEYDYPEYPQLYPPFDPHVSIVDLLFMTGENASTYIW